MSFKKILCLLSLFFFPGFTSAYGVDGVDEVRLYAMDCGYAQFKDLGAILSDTGELAGKPGVLADPCFLIRHPKGTLLWDTGLGDKIAESPNGVDLPEFGIHFRVPVKLADQLHELGLSPSDITFVAFSHFHSDHTGNAGLFLHSTWILNRNELEFAGRVPVAPSVDAGMVGLSKQAKVELIDEDYDVFGDGSVRILRTPGHTPGHQSLELKLKGAGTVLLSGDLYHLRDSRSLRLVPPLNAERADTLASIDRFERIAKNTHARVVIQHDRDDFKALPKFPAYLN